MPTNKSTSPFGPAFTSAIKRGTPCWTAVTNIATRSKKTPTVVFNSLCKAGLCYRQKVNGQWIYWPTNTPKKYTSKNTKFCQTNMWQWFVEWCISSGQCTPQQLHNWSGSQPKFMSWCNKFWSKQFSTSTKTRKSGTTKSKSKGKTKSFPHSFKFPSVKSRPSTSTRRYRKVA